MMRKNDFTLAMLMRLGRVSKYDVARIEQVCRGSCANTSRML
jgi:hypothetical protein